MLPLSTLPMLCSMLPQATLTWLHHLEPFIRNTQQVHHSPKNLGVVVQLLEDPVYVLGAQGVQGEEDEEGR